MAHAHELLLVCAERDVTELVIPMDGIFGPEPCVVLIRVDRAR
jgi:hypothetical protein